MDYTINRYVRERLDGTETWKGHATGKVREHAKRLVETGVAERVEVIDEHNVIVLRWPRKPHRA